MKKFLTILLSAIMLSSCAVAFVGCSKEEESKKIMNVSCNPMVEFVLDKDNKVISVNALNEEGNLIITAETFVGKEAEEAAKLFVQVSVDTGFIISGRASQGENEIEISFSGDAGKAKEIYNKVKTSVETYLTEENITASVAQVEAITKAQLQTLVAECAPYMKEAEVKALEYMELVETLYESRKETVELHSQELKKAYYDAKAVAMQKAELDVLKSKVSALSQLALETAYNAYTSAVEDIETARYQSIIAEDSVYQLALASLRQAKIEVIKLRDKMANMEQNEITYEMSQELERLKSALSDAQIGLSSAVRNVNNVLNDVKEYATSAYETVVNLIQTFEVNLNNHLGEIEQKQQLAKEQAFTAFETQYATAIQSATDSWNAMRTELENRNQPQA